jgi:hypothetical protein
MLVRDRTIKCTNIMNYNTKPYVRIIIAMVFILSSCGMHHDGKQKLCTTEYRMLTVTITDQQSDPVFLTKYYVKKTSTGEITDFSKEDPVIDSINRSHGIYFLCTDGMMSMTSVNGTEFEFHGILDATEIVNEKYIIANDECHVYVVSGPTHIVLTR